MADLFDSYFRKADLDGDGKISGAEAVAFFQGANLSKRVLAQIWNYADQSRTGSLTRADFYNALKLVTVAQSKHELTPDIVKAALVGPASSKIPAPQINFAAIPAPQTSVAGTTPSVSQVSSVGPTETNAGSRSVLPNPTVNQPYSPSPGSGLLRPSNSVSGVATSPVQGSALPNPTVNQPYSPSPGSGLARPPNSFSGVATSPVQGDGFQGFPVVAPSTTSMQPRPPATQNGFVSGTHFGGNALSPPQSLPKRDSPVTSSAASMQVSSASGLSVGGQHPNMQSPPTKDPQIPVPNIRPSGPPAVSPHPPTGYQAQPQWPRATQKDIQKYTKVFVEVDTDKDGKITGDQARNLFLSWRLPREILKQVWNLSDQDNDSMLSLREFCIALYLMERYREGRPLPPVLPNSVMLDFPANAQLASGYVNQSWGYSAGIHQPQAGAGQRPSARPPGKPPLPVPAPLSDDRLPPKPQKAKVPVLEKHLVDQLSDEEQKSLNQKFQEASEANKKVEDLEKEIKESREKMEFYRVKMQELVLYKSRCDSRLNEVTERAAADKREVEALAKKYEEKYLQAGNVASRLTIEEATFRDIQEKKMEMYQAIVKVEQEESDETLQVRADRIQSNLEELVRSLSERCKKYGLRSKPTTLVELPFGWQPGIQEGAADWDEDWDKFEDEGFTFVKEMTIDVQNVIAPPKPKVKVSKKEKASSAKGEADIHTSDAESKPVKPTKEDELEAENGTVANHKEDNKSKSPATSPSARSSPHEGSNKNHFEKTVGSTTSPSSEQSVSNIGVGDTSSSGDKKFDEPKRGTFDSSDDADSVWGSSKAIGHERHIDDLFGQGEFTLPPIRTSSSQTEGFGQGEFTLPPIRTSSSQTEGFLPNKNSIFADSVPSTPAEVFLPKKSIFDGSVPSTPAGDFLPKQSIFADSVPSTPLFSSSYSPHKDSEEQDNRGFNFSRFDSFRSTDSGFHPQEKLSRFDSMRSTQDFDSHDDGPLKFSRFDSMKSTNDSDFGLRFSSFDDADPFGSTSFKSSFGSETPRSEVDPFGSTGPFRPSLGNETPRADPDPFGSTGPFRSSLGSETPRSETDFYSSAGPFRSSFGSETPRAETDHFSSAGPFVSSFGNETPRRESDYFGYSGSFKSSTFDSETPRGDYNSFGFGGPLGSSFSSETPRRDSDAFGSAGLFKTSTTNETPKGGYDSWNAF